MLVSVVSFGFRYGIPSEADLVFDVRFLPNPHFIPTLRRFSGKDQRVARYIRSFPQTKQFLRRIESLLRYLIPHYINEGKSYLTVALGCTGGRHRSVALAEVIRHDLQQKGYATKVVHRDLEKTAS
jgi:RNase adapter protein RapZ